jgi:rhodanese-related sulfurtransferase
VNKYAGAALIALAFANGLMAMGRSAEEAPLPAPVGGQSGHKSQGHIPPAWAGAGEHIDLVKARQLSKNKKVLFVDARANVEYLQGHIPGAISLPIGEFDKYFAENESKIKKAKKLVPYCHGARCNLSEKVARRLVQDKGFTNVAVFFGGWPEWSGAGLPVEK